MTKREVRSKRASLTVSDEEEKFRTEVTKFIATGANPQADWPWWRIRNKSMAEFAFYYQLCERTLFRMRNDGVDLCDVRQVLQYMVQSARSSRGQIRNRLMRWNDTEGGRIRNR